jgi:hypothetical protein
LLPISEQLYHLCLCPVFPDQLYPLEIAQRLAAEYEVDEEKAKASVVKLMEELEQEGLIIP